MIPSLSLSSISFFKIIPHGVRQRIRPRPDWIIISKLYLMVDYASFAWNIRKNFFVSRQGVHHLFLLCISQFNPQLDVLYCFLLMAISQFHHLVVDHTQIFISSYNPGTNITRHYLVIVRILLWCSVLVSSFDVFL